MNIVTNTFLVRPGYVWLAPKNFKVGAGLLNGYGGHFEKDIDATIIDTAIREIWQESHVVVSPNELIKILEIDFYKGDEHTFHCYIFMASRTSWNPKATKEAGEPEEFHRDKVPYERMMPGDKLWLPDVLIGRIMPQGAFIRYSEDMTKITEHHVPSST